MSCNDKNLEDLQEYIDDLNSALEEAMDREEMWKEHCRALREELLEVNEMLTSNHAVEL